MADDPYAFLSGISANPTRPGDTSNFNPDFASRLAAAIKQAQAQGLNVGVASGYRNPLELSKQGNPNANFDAAGNSLHSYGLAADVNGIGQPGSATAKTWASIAAQNGLYNPYNPNGSEWNHWQAVPFTLDQRPDAKAALSKAASTGNFQNVWAAANPFMSGAPTAVASAAPVNPGAPTPIGAAPRYSFNLPANAPMGMGNNNPLNIKYYAGAPYAGLVGPSKNTDQGDPQMVFSSPEAGWSAAYSLLSKKYGSGMTTPNAIIAGKGGWTPGNTQAAANVAKAAGIGPGDDIGFSDPAKAQKFMRALVQQEQGATASAYPDAMIAGAVTGNNIPTPAAPGPIDPSIIARGGYSPPIPGAAAPATPAAPAVPGMSLAGLPGSGTPGGDSFTKGATALDKAIHGDQSPGQEGGQAAAFMPVPARNVSPLLPMARQVYGNTLTSMATPLQWSAQSPGQAPYDASGGQSIGQQFGTQLGSIQQMRQMMAMMGSPYASPFGTMSNG